MSTGITREQIHRSQKRHFAVSPQKAEWLLKALPAQSNQKLISLLESEPSITAGANNFQDIAISKFQDVGKTSVALEGTVKYEMQNNRQQAPKAGSIIQQHDTDKTECEVISFTEVDGNVYWLAVNVRRVGGRSIVLRHEDLKTIILPSFEYAVKDLSDIGDISPTTYLDRIPLPSSGLPFFHGCIDGPG
jgi:hypothetical protein